MKAPSIGLGTQPSDQLRPMNHHTLDREEGSEEGEGAWYLMLGMSNTYVTLRVQF